MRTIATANGAHGAPYVNPVVTPAQAGVQLITLASRLRRNDDDFAEH
jgi:hypothetical protein